MELYIYKANLTRVVDGDTVDAEIDLGFDITLHERIRLQGIDTPEIRTKDEAEKEKGFAAKQRLTELLAETGGEFTVKTFLDKKGKYGRVIGTLYTEGREDSLNAILVQEGHAEIYA